MKRILMVLGFVALLPLAAHAQDAPKAELFGGYSYVRANTDKGVNLHGWNASLSGNVNNWLGVVADFSGHYGSPFFSEVAGGVDTKAHHFLFGPRFSVRQNERWTPFAQALFGIQHARASRLGLSLRDNSFAMTLGGGLDLKLSDRLGLRVIQAEYLRTRFDNATQNNARLSFGVVFRFGGE